MDLYVSGGPGNWEKAKVIMEKTKNMLPGKIDGPSCNILNVMAEHNFKCPANWRGYQKEEGMGH